MTAGYPVMPKERSREVRTEIRRVFNDIWDPIGVMSDPTWPRDEYDSYIGHMFELLTSNADEQQIREYLDWCVARMGMDQSRHSHQDVVDALRKIPLH